MGAKLSVSQRRLYNQVVGVLLGGQKQFKRGDVKQFVWWLSLQFSDILAQKLLEVSFWDRVGSEILRLGDPSLSKFLFVAMQIRDFIKKNFCGQTAPQFTRQSPMS